VLLVSDSVSSLAPLQLFIESQTRVLSTNIAQALRCQFLPTVIVVECSSTAMADNMRTLRDGFPKIPIIVLRQNGDSPIDPREGYRVDPIVESSSVDGVLAQLLRYRAINHAIVPHAAATAAVKFMAAHYDEPLTVSAIAKATNVSEGRLAHIFPDTTGFSVKDYMIRLRVSIARRLLNETSDTVHAIATRTGYADVSHFSRTFKSIDGISPGEFRRRRSRE
jgi:AraC-like DNA-binding protein